MLYNNELKLIAVAYDDDQNRSETRTTILCGTGSVTSDRDYQARQAGLFPSIVFIVHNVEYGGETEAEYHGERYKVIRTWRMNPEEIELTCERMKGR